MHVTDAGFLKPNGQVLFDGCLIEENGCDETIAKEARQSRRIIYDEAEFIPLIAKCGLPTILVLCGAPREVSRHQTIGPELAILIQVVVGNAKPPLRHKFTCQVFALCLRHLYIGNLVLRSGGNRGYVVVI
mmetsp:Transcript_5588/g.5403  ORF Transcript_5588/g.5403 Transcript_5588/m.5403 type:complete len:131 (-) Transcript_5588:1690-2082(-)